MDLVVPELNDRPAAWFVDRLSGLLAIANQIAMLIGGVLDGQAPDVEIVTDRNDDVDNKAAIDTNTHSEHQEHESHLIDIATQGAGPAVTSLVKKDRAY